MTIDSGDEVESSAQRIQTASHEIVGRLIDHYKSPQGVHAETFVAAASAITGEWALWSLEQPLPEKGWVVGDAINAATIEGENAIWRVVSAGAREAGVAEVDMPDIVTVVARTAEAIGGSPFPPLSIAKDHYPREWSPLAAARFRGDMRNIASKNDLTPQQMLIACGTATGLAIVATKEALDPRLSTQLALEMIVGVSRMAPIESEAAFLEGMAET